MSRWTFPLVPDNNNPAPLTSSSSINPNYEHQRSNIYLSVSRPPSLARTATVGPLTLLGPDTIVAHDGHVSHSVLGANCRIGSGSIVRGCVLMSGTVIDSGCVLEGCVVGENVRVLKDSRVSKGCLVGDGVVLGPAARLPPFTRVSRRRAELKLDKDEEDSDIQDAEEGEYTFILSSQFIVLNGDGSANPRVQTVAWFRFQRNRLSRGIGGRRRGRRQRDRRPFEPTAITSRCVFSSTYFFLTNSLHQKRTLSPLLNLQRSRERR